MALAHGVDSWRDVGRSWLLSHGEVLPLMALALGLSLVYLASADVLGLPYDDSYISLQFARNLAKHGYITFDGETAAAGATSLLHVAILAIPIKLGGDPVKVSLASGIIFHLALVASVYWLAWSIFRERWTASVAAASVGVMGYLTLDALNGMETTLFLAVTAAAAAAFFDARTWRGYLASGILVGLSVLTRPEGVLLLGAMGLYYIVTAHGGTVVRVTLEDLRRVALIGMPSVLALVGLASFYWATTGAVTPGAATAKLFFFREFELSYLQRFNLAQGGVANFIGPVLPWLVLAGFAVRRREAVLFALFWVAFIIMYYALFPGGLTHYWYRYQHVFLPPLAVFGAAGLVSVLRGRTWRALDVVAAAAVGFVLLGTTVFQYENFRNHYAFEIDLNEGRQVVMAEFLRDEVPPGVAIATHDIGAIGYFSEREVIDLVGLVNPDVIDSHDGRELREYVDDVQPGYIVVLEAWEDLFIQLGLKDSPELFEPIRIFPGGRAGTFTVYRTHYSP